MAIEDFTGDRQTGRNHGTRTQPTNSRRNRAHDRKSASPPERSWGHNQCRPTTALFSAHPRIKIDPDKIAGIGLVRHLVLDDLSTPIGSPRPSLAHASASDATQQ